MLGLDEKRKTMYTDSCPVQSTDVFQSSSKVAKARTSISQTAALGQKSMDQYQMYGILCGGKVERKTFGINLDEGLLELEVCASVALFERLSSA